MAMWSYTELPEFSCVLLLKSYLREVLKRSVVFPEEYGRKCKYTAGAMLVWKLKIVQCLQREMISLHQENTGAQNLSLQPLLQRTRHLEVDTFYFRRHYIKSLFCPMLVTTDWKQKTAGVS